MIEHAQIGRLHRDWNSAALRGAHDHIFQPVGAVGNLLRDPVGCVVPRAAEPVGPEPQHRSEESILPRAVVNDEPHMDDVAGERIDRHRRRVGRGLHELHLVAFRIDHIEPSAAVAAPLRVLWHGDLLRRQIGAQRLRIRRCKGDVIQPIDRGRARGQWQHLDELRLGEVIAHRRRVLGVFPLDRSEIVHVEPFGLRWICRVDGDMRDSSYWRACRWKRAGRSGTRKRSDRGAEAFHRTCFLLLDLVDGINVRPVGSTQTCRAASGS